MNKKIALCLLATFLLTTVSFADAQQAKKVPLIGFLNATSLASAKINYEAFRQGLRDLGYIDGQNIAIEHRYAEGVTERLPNLATVLVRLKVDVISTGGTAATLAAKNATTTIPIVMSNVDDPVAFGLIDSLGRPGGNITGLTSGAGPGLYGKRLELLKESLPRVSRGRPLESRRSGLRNQCERDGGPRSVFEPQASTCRDARTQRFRASILGHEERTC